MNSSTQFTLIATKKFLTQLFKDIRSHIAWSNVYEVYVITEPIWYVRKSKNKLVGCVDLSNLLFNITSYGQYVVNNVESMDSSDIEQLAIEWEIDYMLMNDDPAIFPHSRVEYFLLYLKDNIEIIRNIDGIAHYHIDMKELSEGDIETLLRYTSEISKLGRTEQLGIVISQKDPRGNFQLLNADKSIFIESLFEQLYDKQISLGGKLFRENKVIKDINIISQGKNEF